MTAPIRASMGTTQPHGALFASWPSPTGLEALLCAQWDSNLILFFHPSPIVVLISVAKGVTLVPINYISLLTETNFLSLTIIT